MPPRTHGILGALGALLLLGSACAAAAAPQPPQARFALAVQAFLDGEAHRAITLSEEFLQPRSPFFEPALYLSGRSFQTIRLFEKAEAAYHRLVVERPKSRFAVYAVLALGRVFFSLGEYNAVVGVQRTYAGKVRGVPSELLYLTGVSYYLMDQHADARSSLESVPSGSPSYAWARMTLAQIEYADGNPDRAIAELDKALTVARSGTSLFDRAVRMKGMILYSAGRFAQSAQVYPAIGAGGVLFGRSRLDQAVAAEAAENPALVASALEAVRNGTKPEEPERWEAEIRLASLRARQGNTAEARSILSMAVSSIRLRGHTLTASVSNEGQFSAAFDELVRFAQAGSAHKNKRLLAEDLELLGALAARKSRPAVSTGVADVADLRTISPKSPLFPLLQRQVYRGARLQPLAELAQELDDLRAKLAGLHAQYNAASSLFRRATPVAEVEVPEAVDLAIEALGWVALTQFDVTSRCYDELAVSERITEDEAVAVKGKLLVDTVMALRASTLGTRSMPTREGMERLMERAGESIRKGEVRGASTKRMRESLENEWKNDHNALRFLYQSVALKESQMNRAVKGLALRSRNLNLPVLTNLIEWLEALARLRDKYLHLGVSPAGRSWRYAGRGEELQAVVSRLADNLARARQALVSAARRDAAKIVAADAQREQFLLAQAEEELARAAGGR